MGWDWTIIATRAVQILLATVTTKLAMMTVQDERRRYRELMAYRRKSKRHSETGQEGYRREGEWNISNSENY